MNIGNGSIPLRIGNIIDTEVYGGPYRDRPPQMFGVKMAQEIDEVFNVDVPTRDYDVPAISDLRMGIVRTLMAMVNDRTVYVGCWGGIGRTGLFLAALVKVQIEYRAMQHRTGGGEDPVVYVREHFMQNAVETSQQMKFIADFDVSEIVNWLHVTQTAMGLGGFTPARNVPEQALAAAVMMTPGVCSCEAVVRLDGIHEGGCVVHNGMNPTEPFTKEALDNFKADWKERYRGNTLQAEDSTLVERDPDWIDNLFADSKDEGTEAHAQWLHAESLQQQIDELEERVELAEGNLVSVTTTLLDVKDAVTTLGKTVFELIKDLTKPKEHGKIRTWFKKWIKDSDYNGM